MQIQYQLFFACTINNYRDFLTEFYTCIGGEGSLENVPNAATYRKFKTVFGHGKR
jgi:hypothetical protein